jgi:hypothetical protein
MEVSFPQARAGLNQLFSYRLANREQWSSSLTTRETGQFIAT